MTDDKPTIDPPPADKFVFCVLPRCPRCDSHSLKTTRSIDNGDGSRTHRKRCRDCHHAFSVVWE
jgi:transposase-like protein